MLCTRVIHKINRLLEPCVLATHQLTCNRWCKNYTTGFNGGMWHSFLHPNSRSSKFGAKLWCSLQNPYVSPKVQFCNLEVFIFCEPSFKVFKESEVVLNKVFICVCEFKDEVLWLGGFHFLWVVTKGFEGNQGCFEIFCFWGTLLEVF